MKWNHNIDHWPGTVPDFPLDGTKCALLIVDMQYESSSRNFGFGLSIRSSYPQMHEYYYDRIERVVIPNQQRLASSFRHNGWDVIHIIVGPFRADGRDMIARRKERQAMRKQSGDFYDAVPSRILSELTPAPEELVIQKNSASAFNSTGIDQILRNMGVTQLVVTGVLTHSCVELTARDAADRGYECTVVEDACATFDEETHGRALRNFARHVGMVKSTDEVLHLLGVG